MEKDLGQDEIDALFAPARGDASKELSTALRDISEQGGEHGAFDFSGAGQISNDQMKAISTVNDLFARNLTHNLGAWLRTQFEVTLVSGEQMVYAEFLERIPEPAYVCSTRLEPLDALGLIQMDLAFAPPIVDLLLGGVGRAGAVREPTDIEHEILLSVMEIVVRELNVAWQPTGLKFALERREMEAELSRLMAPTEKMLSVSFEIRMPEAHGTLNLCLPAVVLNIILRRLSAGRSKPKPRSSATRARLTELMLEARFGAVLRSLPLRLNARELADLAPGKVLRLPLPHRAMSELCVGGLPIFRAQPVCSGEHRGAQVREHNTAAERGSV